MKDYYTRTAYMGYVPRFKMYLPFPTEQDYKEFFEEEEIKELRKGEGTSRTFQQSISLKQERI